MYSKYLCHFVNEISDSEARKLKLPIRDLLVRHLIVKHTKRSTNIVNKGISENIPRWVHKFKFLHKKYGLVVESSELVSYTISDKGSRLLKTPLKKDKKDEKDGKDKKEDIKKPVEESEDLE